MISFEYFHPSAGSSQLKCSFLTVTTIYRNSKFQMPNFKRIRKFKSQYNVANSLWSLGFGVFLAFGIWHLGFVSAVATEPALTYVDLVRRLIDLEYLATIPASDEHCTQW